jgi:hypothetical protein
MATTLGSDKEESHAQPGITAMKTTRTCPLLHAPEGAGDDLQSVHQTALYQSAQLGRHLRRFRTVIHCGSKKVGRSRSVDIVGWHRSWSSCSRDPGGLLRRVVPEILLTLTMR